MPSTSSGYKSASSVADFEDKFSDAESDNKKMFDKWSKKHKDQVVNN